MLDGVETKYRTAAKMVMFAVVPAMTLAAVLVVVLAAIDDEGSDLPTMSIFPLPTGTEWSVAAAEPEQSQLVTRSYDVADLADRTAGESTTEPQGPPEVVRQSVLTIGNAAAQPRPAQPDATAQRISAEWDDTHPGRLVVQASEETHEDIAELLQLWRTHGFQQWVVEIRVIDIPRSVSLPLSPGGQIVSAQSTGTTNSANRPPVLDDHETASGTASVVTTRAIPLYLEVIDDSTVRHIVDVAQGHARANVMFAPKVTLFAGQPATVVSGVERPFVTGLNSLGWSKPNPHVEVIQEGQLFDVRVMPGEDPETVTLSCGIRFSHVSDVGTAGVLDSRAQPTVVQVPSVEQVRITAAAELTANETLLLAPLKANANDNSSYFLITVRPVEE